MDTTVMIQYRPTQGFEQSVADAKEFVQPETARRALNALAHGDPTLLSGSCGCVVARMAKSEYGGFDRYSPQFSFRDVVPDDNERTALFNLNDSFDGTPGDRYCAVKRVLEEIVAA